VPARSQCAIVSAVLAASLASGACAPYQPAGVVDAAAPFPQPAFVPHSEWEARPPLGYAADARRRNLRPGEQLAFHDLVVAVAAARHERGTAFVDLRLARGGVTAARRTTAGDAFAWQGYRIAVVAAPAPGELGGGLVALEVATLASLPPHVASAPHAGDAELRLRVPHRITHVTLHHTGSAEALRPDEDPVQKLRSLQSWGASDRNWWDVPYHFLIDLSGRIYEGRDWRYMGETNTTYDPTGHLLISVIGNYDIQPATAAQLGAIADLMAWALDRFELEPDRIGGHYEHAATVCPGQHLRAPLEDGTLLRMIAARRAPN
jgi:hypothetical protein